MEQKNKTLYELDKGELVTVQIVPTRVSQPHAQAALNGQPLPHSPSGELSFQFIFSGNETVLLIEGEFVNPQPDSRYDVRLSASNEEEKHGPTLNPEKKVVEIIFRTRTGPPK